MRRRPGQRCEHALVDPELNRRLYAYEQRVRGRFGAIVESVTATGKGASAPAQIVVERAMYSHGPGAAFWAAGKNALATKLQ